MGDSEELAMKSVSYQLICWRHLALLHSELNYLQYHIPCELWFESWLSHFQSSSLLLCSRVQQKIRLQYVDPAPPLEIQKKLLALAWSNPGPYSI